MISKLVEKVDLSKLNDPISNVVLSKSKDFACNLLKGGILSKSVTLFIFLE